MGWSLAGAQSRCGSRWKEVRRVGEWKPRLRPMVEGILHQMALMFL